MGVCVIGENFFSKDKAHSVSILRKVFTIYIEKLNKEKYKWLKSQQIL
jgi:hypothetical protein